jgi:hypothetical protein
VTLQYASRSEREIAFRDELRRELGTTLTIYRSADGERIDLEGVLSSAPDDAVFYVCGPERLIVAVQGVAAALNIASDRVRIERFTAQGWRGRVSTASSPR